MKINWDKWRREDSTINLVDAYTSIYLKPSYEVIAFLSNIEFLQPIRSRQAAAIALAMAFRGVLRHENG